MPVDKRIVEIVDYLKRNEKDNYLANCIIDNIGIKFDTLKDLYDHLTLYLEPGDESEKDKELISLLDKIESICSESKPVGTVSIQRGILSRNFAASKLDMGSKRCPPALPTDSLELVMDLISKYSEVQGKPSLVRNKMKLIEAEVFKGISENQSSENYMNLLNALLDIGEKVSWVIGDNLGFVIDRDDGRQIFAALASLYKVVSCVSHEVCNQVNAKKIADVANSINDLGKTLDVLLKSKQLER